MLNWLKSLFNDPKPAGPPEQFRQFQTSDATLTQSGISVSDEGWLVEAREPQTIRLFEVTDPNIGQCLLAYRASLKAEALDGRAYLEMWCRFPGAGEFFSKGLNQTLSGSADWGSFEIPFLLKKGQRPDLIKLNLAIEGKGKVWIKDVQLLKTPV